MSVYPRFACPECERDYHALLNPMTCPHCGATLFVEDDEPDVELPLSFWFFTQERKEDAVQLASEKIISGFETLLAGEANGSQDKEEDLS